MKFLFHIHTKHSYDSLLNPKAIVDYAIKNDIKILAITDHDTIQGSIDASIYVKNTKKNIEIIIGAEYKTDCGDIIGLFLKNEIQEKNAIKVIDEIHQQGGIAILPHPYNSHKLTVELIDKVDIIEVYNARCNDSENKKAFQLAQQYNKPIIFGNDAHIFKELALGFNFINKNYSIPDAIKHISEFNAGNTTKTNIVRSQIIKAYKKKDIILLLKMIKSLISIKMVSKFKKTKQ